jgi:hypothetical protein
MQAHGKRGTVWDWLFRVLVHPRLGHPDEAKQWLDKAVAWIEKADQEKTLGPRDRLELRWLRREAEALVNAQKR